MQVTGKDLLAQDEELYNNLESLGNLTLTGEVGFTFSVTVCLRSKLMLNVLGRCHSEGGVWL